jgi:undecaprenyl-diphosphatase
VTVLEAIILGVVQGLTEFLPVSSSGHLVLAPEFLGIPAPPIAFDVLLHLATLVAVAGYFSRELWAMLVAFVAPGRLTDASVKEWRRLALWLVAGSIPAALAGYFMQGFFEELFASTLAVGIFLVLTGCLLVLADVVAARMVGSGRSMDSMGLVDAVVVGCYQALAIAPGLSRSGATISGGVFLGFSRETAARFSFLLSIPVILGAGLLSARDLRGEMLQGQLLPYLLGSLAAAVTALLAVHFLLRYLRNHRLWVFALYVFIVGVLVVGLSLV